MNTQIQKPSSIPKSPVPSKIDHIKHSPSTWESLSSNMSLFERSCISIPQLFFVQSLQDNFVFGGIQNIKDSLSLKSILKLRLVSKTLYELVSTHRLLERKAIINLDYETLSSKKLSSKEEFCFVQKEKTKICIVSSIDHFLSLSSMMDRFQAHEPQLCLKITNLTELQRLDSLLSKEIALDINAKITKLDLSEIPIDKNTIDSIYALVDHKKLACFPGLSSIAFGDSYGDVSLCFTVPNISELGITQLSFKKVGQLSLLASNLQKLKDLHIENFSAYGDSIEIADPLPCLENLSFGYIKDGRYLKLPSSFPLLRNFYIGGLDASLNLSTELPNLSSIFIGKIESCCNNNLIFELTASCPKLMRLEIGDLVCSGNTDGRLALTVELTHAFLPNLMTLKIGDISSKCTVTIPSFPSLNSLEIGTIHEGSKLRFIRPLDSLHNLTIGDIDCEISLPSMKNLKHYSVGKIADANTFLAVTKALSSNINK